MLASTALYPDISRATKNNKLQQFAKKLECRRRERLESSSPTKLDAALNVACDG